ncbi:DivIVA domain-containing protein [Micromonospora sp. NPDC005710]|uniref:DivIVA domain-containing protein n=1 Tax=Micromonospora sp. NPDC005710 TaxID=3157051 RepID=UPI0033C20BE5
MAVYRSRNALAGPLTPTGLRDVALTRTRLGQRGYRPDDVHALLDRLAFEHRTSPVACALAGSASRW